MRRVPAVPRLAEQLAERHKGLFAVTSIVVLTLLWPLVLVWLALWHIGRYRARDMSPAAKRQRRITRLLGWWPREWRARYGDELAALMDDMMDNGHGGLRLSRNVAKEGLAARLAPPARRDALAVACLGMCGILIFPQALVPAVLKLTDAPTRSWFLALHLPDAYQWPLIGVSLALGLALLRTGLSLTSARLIPPRD